MKSRDKMRQLILNSKNKDIQSFAKLLTLIEKAGIGTLDEPSFLQVTPPSFRLGITGPPGAGKSTLINQLISDFRQKDFSVGVLAIDPSSPVTGGAILGDRIRYQDHFLDEKVFIRSLGTRGSLGGLCSSAYLMLRAYDLFGFDRVIVETVGVGQSELDIVNVADHITILLVPESGDSIQMMKAGVLEIADSFIVNKSDRPGAEALVAQLRSELSYSETEKEKQIFSIVAQQNKNVSEYTEYLDGLNKDSTKRNSPQSLRKEAKALLNSSFELFWNAQAQNVTDVATFRETIDQSYKKLRIASKKTKVLTQSVEE